MNLNVVNRNITNINEIKNLIKTILKYSAIKIEVKKAPLKYLVLNFETNSEPGVYMGSQVKLMGKLMGKLIFES